VSAAPVSLGFLRPDPSRVTAHDPDVTYGHGIAMTQGRAAEWDYSAPVRVEWRVAVNLAGVIADCGLGDAARIAAVVSWHSTWTNLRGAGDVIIVVDGENTLGLEIPGEVAGGTLNLTMTVTLGDPGREPHALAPRRAGSPLWSQHSAVILEGAAARMPVMAVDFAETGRGRKNGVWLLECGRDLTASVTGALLVYLNTDHPEVQRLLEQPADPASRELARFIAYDVIRQLTLRALLHDELDERQHYDEGTLGDLFIGILRTHLPGRTLDQLRAEFEDDPGEIEAELLSRAWGTNS
jgi:hypothetical protein